MLLSHSRLASVLVALVALLPSPLRAQDGSNDPSFNPADDGTFGTGADSHVSASVVQPDGRIVIAGSFSAYNSAPRRGLARLSPDGGVDPTLQTAPGPNGSILSVALQPDGKLIVAGGFTSYDAVPRASIARVNSDGSLDPTFDPGAGPEPGGYVQTVALQPDGKLIVGGWFTLFGGVPRKRIARLNADGSLDPTFDSSNGANTTITRVVLQSDGKLLIGGYFTHYGGVSRNRIARLNADGSLDTSFDPGLGALGDILAVALQPDGKVVVGGTFQTIGAISRRYLARFHPDGGLDMSFDPGGGPDHYVRTLALQPDGRLLIGGSFSSVQGVPRNIVARLESNGALDASFTPPDGTGTWAADLQLLATGKLLVCGYFYASSGFERSAVSVLDSSGSVDLGFNSLPAPSERVNQIVFQSDGRALVLGSFDYYNSVARRGIARIEPDGALDASFDPQLNARASVGALQPDGKVLIAGGFTTVGGAARQGLARLESNGAVDLSFDAGAAPGSGIAALALQPDGKLLVAGWFTSFNGVPRARIARVEANGALDLSFDPLAGVGNYNVDCLALQPDGAILLGGEFTSVGGAVRHRIARLKPSGQLDTSFQPSPGADWVVREIALTPSGKILISGPFTRYNGVLRGGIARINSDGSLDTGFAPGPGLALDSGGGATAYAIRLQPDHKILLAGSFTSAMGRPRRNIARLHPNGTLDDSFPALPGASYTIAALELDATGRALIGGIFLWYDGAVRHRIARLIAYSPAPSSYCTAGVSTNGCVAKMDFDGAPSIAGASGFALKVKQLEGQRQALLFYGIGGRRADPWATGSTSFLCVKAPVQRMLAGSSAGSAGQCNGALSADWLNYVATNPSALGAPFAAGIAVTAQAWYRDPPAPRSTNLSDALEFVTTP